MRREQAARRRRGVLSLFQVEEPISHGFSWRFLRLPIRARLLIVMPDLDEQRLEELHANLPPDLLAGLVERCLRDIALRLPILQSSAASGQSVVTKAEAHALAGMAANYAMSSLEVRLRQVMQAENDGNIAAAREAAAGLDEVFVRTDEVLRSIFSLVSR